MPSVDHIRQRLAVYAPRCLDAHEGQRAAVAMVLRDGPAGRAEPEVLFIERARDAADPWSGHMAFPGGRVDPGDADTRAAAERETLEEVGLSLADVVPMGRLDDKTGRAAATSQLVISAYVYHLPEVPELEPNHEVASILWFPLRGLLDPAHHVPYPMQQYDVEMPGIQVGLPGRHIVWGLTYSFLESFFVAVERPLPDRWRPELSDYARGMSKRRGA